MLDSTNSQNLADLNSSLGASCVDFGNLGRFADLSPVSHPKFPKNSTTSTANTRICDFNNTDSANSQNLSENQVKKSLSKFLLRFAFAKRRVPPNFIDSNLSNKIDSQNLVKNNPSLRDSAKQNRGNPPIKKTQNLQRGLPRSHSLARNDENLDSSLRLHSTRNDKVGIYDYNFGVRVAESTKIPTKYAQ